MKAYLGVKGYIYSAQDTADVKPLPDIPFAYTSNNNVSTDECEIVLDAYQAIIDAEQLGLIHINRYEALSEKKLQWIQRAVREEYRNCDRKPEYKFFLEGKFGELLK